MNPSAKITDAIDSGK